jgi:DNA-binding transcriptional LysR family regulator
MRRDTTEMKPLNIERFFRSQLKLSQVRLVVAIAELQQLSRVALSLNVTAPAVSKQIAEFERSLKHKILKRVGNRVEFTDVGALLVRRSRELLDHVKEVGAELDAFSAGKIGRIGVGVAPSVAPLFLPSIVAILNTEAPNVAIEVREGNFDALAPLLDSSELDLIITRETHHRKSANFHEEHVLSDPIVIVSGASWPIAKRRPLFWRHLNNEKWLLPERGSHFCDVALEFLEGNSVSPSAGSIHSSSLTANVALVQSHPYVTFMPLAFVRRYQFRDAEKITVLPLSTRDLLGSVKVVRRRDDERPVIALLTTCIRNHAQSI